MSYKVLARKWRPKNFEEVRGQEHVLRVLISALTQKRLHHAYLFAGTRGVGKTTIARILAKCLNCETGITATPCGKCNACIEIDNGRFIDLLEVDAASRTKVEDTRSLLDNVQYLPTKGRFKVYIIDEIHMLSGHSFNALLKTLEEPPEHVKFLLATTDPQKLPITVLSRCLQFNLKALSPDFIQKQLQHILSKETIEYEISAINQLALAACGSVRDALSLLEQAIAFGNGKVIKTDVDSMLGTVDTAKIFGLLEALASNDANAILKIIAQLTDLSTDFINVMNELLEILQRIAIIQLVPDTITDSWQSPELLKKLATNTNPEEIQLYYQICLIGKRDISLAPSLRSGFEMIMLRMLSFRLDTTNDSTQTITESTINQPMNSDLAPTPTASFDIQNINILRQLNVTEPSQALLANCIISKIDKNEVELLLEPNQAMLLNKKHEERINKAFSEYLNHPVTVTIKVGTPNMDTISNISKREAFKKQTQALQAIEKDHKIKKLISKFDAKIVSNSVKLKET